MTDRRHISTPVAVMVAVLLLGAAFAGLGPARTSVPQAGASTNEDGANWVPFIGDYELWCTMGNPGFSGCSSHHNRPAMDIGMPIGVTIRAAGDGVVQAAGNDGDGRGTYVQIEHAGGRTSHYYHLSSESVSVGQQVETGDVIGKSGNTGSTSAPHLHYEEKNAAGRSVEPGVMHSLQNGQLVDYPTAGGSTSWFQVPYGTRIKNEGYSPGLFSDITLSTWNYAAIEWAVQSGLATGYPDGTWRNGTELTRAQSVMWIWRTAGEPAATGSAPHPDVPPSVWYRPALDWAAGIPGMLDQFGAEFGSETPVTRGQLAVMLWARAGKPLAGSAGFTDTVLPDEIAAADWMAARGYMTGYGDGTFRPANALGRGEGVMALYRERLFDDVGATAWNRPAVDWARWRAVMVGYPDHTFRPVNPVTRSESVVMMWRHAGYPVASASAGFTDVPPGSWYAAAADWAAEVGIVNGYLDGTFRGNNPISRAEYVMIMWRQAGQPPPGTPHSFSDVPPGAWYENGVSWAAEQGVMTGVNGQFLGNDDINRGQTVNSFFKAVQLPA